MVGILLATIGGALKGVFGRLFGGPSRPTWGFRLEVAVAIQRAMLGHLIGLPTERLRVLSRASLPLSEEAKQVAFEAVEGDVQGAFFRPPRIDGPGIVLFLHGGGYVVGSVDSHRDLVARLALAGGFEAFSLEYRLAPENPYPAALDDALAAWSFLRSRGYEASQIAVAGDSAGGGLGAALVLRLRELGEEGPAAAGLISPWIDLTFSSPSLQANRASDYIDVSMLSDWANAYLAGEDARNPLVSPFLAKHDQLAGWPPTLIQVGGGEILRDEGLSLGTRLREAGVDVSVGETPDMPHDWHLLANVEPRGQRATEELAHFLRARLSPSA